MVDNTVNTRNPSNAGDTGHAGADHNRFAGIEDNEVNAGVGIECVDNADDVSNADNAGIAANAMGADNMGFINIEDCKVGPAEQLILTTLQQVTAISQTIVTKIDFIEERIADVEEKIIGVNKRFRRNETLLQGPIQTHCSCNIF